MEANPRGNGEAVEHPSLNHLAQAVPGPLGLRSIALTGLFFLACVYTLYFAQAVLLPIVIALLLNFLFSPIVRGMVRVGIPRSIAAAVVILGVLAVIGIGVYELSAPVSQWIRRAPEIARKLEGQIRPVKKPVEAVTKATAQVEKLTQVGGANQPPKVEVQQPSISEAILNQTGTFLFGAVALLILLYFLLASGDLFLGKVVKVLPRLQDKKRAVQIAREIESSISRYMFTHTAINCGVGVASGIACWAMEVPNPLLWGVLAAVLNYVPYLGAIAGSLVTGLAAAGTFDSIGRGAMVAGVMFGITSIEGYFITPWIMGKRLLLNPVVIFIGLSFWGWLWGMPGALLAVPIMAMLKIFCDRIEPLAPIGEFLGE